MKQIFLWLVPIVVVAAVLAWATVSRAQSVRPADDALAMYEGLRALALATKPGDLDIQPGTEPLVYGVVMDMDIDGNTATIVSFATGDTSLYYSTGGGTIGAGGQEPVAAASRAFVAEARNHVPAMTRTADFPRPTGGATSFYVLTSQGVFRATLAKPDGTDPLMTLFMAGQDVITQLRLTSKP